jgi:hypothetical protein
MKAVESAYQFEIQETPDSLIIHYQGRKNRGKAIMILLFMIVYLLGLIVGIYMALTLDADKLNILAFSWVTMPFVLITLIPYIEDLLLDREMITIMADQIRVEKSGFRSIHRTRIFTLRDIPVFHFALFSERSLCIAFRYSGFMSRLKEIGWFFSSKSPKFCSGISAKDGALILDRLHAKFPQFYILKDLDFNMRNMPG